MHATIAFLPRLILFLGVVLLIVIGVMQTIQSWMHGLCLCDLVSTDVSAYLGRCNVVQSFSFWINFLHIIVGQVS